MNGIISTSTNTKNTKKKKKKTSLGPHNCKNKKSVQVCNGCRGRHRIESLSLPPSLQEAKRKTKFGDRTQKHYLPYEERKGQFILLSLQRKREKNVKNTNTLNMDVACEAIDGLALLYLLGNVPLDIHRVP